jgi:hypothetical protein
MLSIFSALSNLISSLIGTFWRVVLWFLFGIGQYLIALIFVATAIWLVYWLMRSSIESLVSAIKSVRKAIKRILRDLRDATLIFRANVIKAAPFETLAKRKIVADDIRASAESFQLNRNDAASLNRLKKAARTIDRFGRCYAIDSLGRIEAPDSEVVRIAAEALESLDPYVREVAAQALLRMGLSALSAVPTLMKALSTHPTEGTGHYAVLALDKIAVNSPELQQSLRKAAFTPGSMVTTKCKNLYERLTGIELTPDAGDGLARRPKTTLDG